MPVSLLARQGSSLREWNVRCVGRLSDQTKSLVHRCGYFYWIVSLFLTVNIQYDISSFNRQMYRKGYIMVAKCYLS